MEEAFRALLLASSGVTALVGTRINWGAHPQGAAMPFIVLTVISGNGGHTLQGRDGLSEGRVQVDCYADTYRAAKLLARAVAGAVDAHQGGQFSGVFHAGTRDLREGGANEADRPYRVSMDFMTHWRDQT